MSLLLKNISLPLAPFTLEVDVEIHGRVTAIFGPSGSGKTSLLELVAGLRPAKSAFIQLGERVLTDTAGDVFVPVRHRGIGYVPQDLALFPHLSVRQNLLYGRKSGRETSHLFTLERVTEVLEIQPLIQRGITEPVGRRKAARGPRAGFARVAGPALAGRTAGQPRLEAEDADHPLSCPHS